MADQASQGTSINLTCQVCQRREASHFCKCTGSPTLFCLDCGFAHQAKSPLAIHQITPVAALSQNPKEYKRKYEALTKASVELRSSVERMERCSSEFAEMMQKCIDYLTEYRSSWLRQLQTEREELALAVETAIKEATTCLSQGGEPANALAQAVWTLPTEELQVFRYTVNTPDLSLLCQNWAHYHNNLKSLCERFHPVPEEELPQLPSQVPRDFFAAISLKTMELYDFNTHQTTKNPLPTCVRSGYVQVDRNTVLVVGTQVLILDLLTLQSTPLASLLTPRDSVGVALVGDTVFAFGGYDGNPMTVCEKCSVPPTRWTELPPMHFARASFTPCSFQALLYLASTRAYDHRAVESFSHFRGQRRADSTD